MLVSALAFAVGGCTTMNRTMSYGMELGDAKPVIDGRTYNIYVHPTDNTLLLQRTIANAAGVGLVEGATFGLAQPNNVHARWRRAAEEFLRPVGCEAVEVYALDQASSWEATFKCPEGVDLRGLVAAQRSALRNGAPLHP